MKGIIKKEEIHCPNCESGRYAVFSAKSSLTGKHYGERLNYICLRCGMHFSNTGNGVKRTQLWLVN